MKSQQKIVATDVMLGIYSLIWTICHKLMWFHRNAVLFHMIFVVMHGEIFGHLGRVPWQSKQNGAAVDVSAEIVSYSHFYWKKYDCNWVTKLRSRYYCNMSRIRPRLIRCHCSFDPRWIKISGHSEQLGPCGSTSHFVNNRHSKSQNSGCALYWRFWPNWWSEKIRAGNSPKSGCVLY